jgi:type VI secretion system protein ImpE
MNAEEQLRAGNVDEALQALQEEVRSKPADAKLRTFLFQLLAVSGQWERALTQLKVLAGLEASTLLLTRIYEQLIAAEQVREEIFSGVTAPVIFGEPEPWMAYLLHGNSLAVGGDFVGAQTALQAALDAAPDTPGLINGVACRWIADVDLRFGPVLEALIDGRYFWVPFFRIAQLRVEPPKHLRDTLWLPAGFRWSNGGEAAGFIFGRYPGSHQAGDPLVRLGRKTEWHDKAEGFTFGQGQRMLATDAEDYPVLEVRSLEFTAS